MSLRTIYLLFDTYDAGFKLTLLVKLTKHVFFVLELVFRGYLVLKFSLDYFAFCFERNDEFCSNTDFTLNIYRASHLFNDLLANAQSKSSASSISFFVLFQLSEVDEEMLQPFFANSNSSINYRKLKVYIPLVTIIQISAFNKWPNYFYRFINVI